jgi:hypothetical protein
VFESGSRLCRQQPLALWQLLLAFNGPRVLKARGGASYTFGALAILVVAPGKKPSRV